MAKLAAVRTLACDVVSLGRLRTCKHSLQIFNANHITIAACAFAIVCSAVAGPCSVVDASRYRAFSWAATLRASDAGRDTALAAALAQCQVTAQVPPVWLIHD